MFLTSTHIPLLRTPLTKFSNLCHTTMQNWLLQRMNLVHKLTSSLYDTFPKNNVYRGITVLHSCCLQYRFWIENILDRRWKKSGHLRTMDTWMNSNVAAECRSEHMGKESFNFNVQMWSLKLFPLLTYAVFADGTRSCVTVRNNNKPSQLLSKRISGSKTYPHAKSSLLLIWEFKFS